MFRRGMALVLGVIALFGALATSDGVPPGLGGAWWVAMHGEHSAAWLVRAVALVTACGLIGISVLPVMRRRWRDRLLVAALAPAALALVVDALSVWRAIGRGEISAPLPVPPSILWLAIFGWIGFCHVRLPPQATSAPRWQPWVPYGAGVACGFALVPLLQILLLGTANQRQTGDWVVVPGAMVWGDGRPSNALEDRMLTACAVFRERG